MHWCSGAEQLTLARCRFLPAREEEETNGDHFELAAPEEQKEVRHACS